MITLMSAETEQGITGETGSPQDAATHKHHSSEPAGKKRPIAGYVYAVAAAMMWGVAGPVAKYLFNNGVTAIALTQIRMTLSFALMMAFFLLVRRDLARIGPKDIPYLAVLGIGGFALVQISYYSAIARIQVAAAILLQYTAPMFILIYAVIFMKETLTRAKLVSLLLAVSGCALVAGVYNIEFVKLNLGGVTWGLISALCFSFYTLYGQAGLQKYTALTLFTYSSGFGAVIWWVLNPPHEFFATHYSATIWGAMLYIIILGTIVPFVFYLKALEYMEASRVSITSTLEPFCAGMIAFLFLGESMGALQVVGGGLVIAGIILLQQSPTPEAVHHTVHDSGAV
jgi:drug/metabolite transporter (DMT)-like permease